MVVPSSLPVHTLKEFIELAKNSPNKLTFGSVGVGTPQHLGGELFKMNAGVDLIHVPFRGATAAIPDLLAGRIDMFIGAINSLLPLIKEGKLRAIAMAGQDPRAVVAGCADHRRSRPSPTSRSAPRSDSSRRPARRPTSSTCSTARSARSSPRPASMSAWQTIGVDVVGTTPAAYAKFLRDDYDKWAKVVAAAGIKPE